MTQNLDHGDEPGVKANDDSPPAEQVPASAVGRLQARTGGYIARHPAMLKVLDWLRRNIPGFSPNP